MSYYEYTYNNHSMENYNIRPILSSDYSSQYLSLLEQDFSIRPNTISLDEFTNYVNKLQDYHQIFVIDTSPYMADCETCEVTYNKKQNDTQIARTIVGSVTIFIETKLIHNFGKVAHIEDVIVDNTCRGRGLGKMLVQKCIDYAKIHDCYKIILNCSDENIPFYEKCGFSKKENEMALYFNDVI
jgi:glucosamine-phosphate N-acetyltransferase